MDMIRTDLQLLNGDVILFCNIGKELLDPSLYFALQYVSPVLGRPDQVVERLIDGMGGASENHAAIGLSLTCVWQRASSPLPNTLIPPRRKQRGSLNVFRATAKQRTASSAKRGPGRPKGSRNTPKTPITLTPELLRIKAMLDALLHLITKVLSGTSLVLAGHFGNHHALQMTRQCALHLISKLRGDAARYFPYTGPYAGRGPRRKYGRKVDDENLPAQYLKETTMEGHIQTCLSQMPLLHKEFAQPLNVVILAKTNLRTQARAHVILFSSDLDLMYAPLVDYYGLRFQIEFNFRDAKQYWGLEDFMHVTPAGVTNAAHLSLFMVNVAYHLRTNGHPPDPAYSVLDLKADCRGYKYVEETIKMLPEKAEPVLLAKVRNQVAGLGRIHVSHPPTAFCNWRRY